MRSVSFFHKDTGVLNPTMLITSDNNVVMLNTPPDHLVIDNPSDGETYDPLRHRVDPATGAVIDWQPPQPSMENTGVTERAARRMAAFARIAALEAAQHRPVRELARDPSNASARTRIDAIDAEIAASRSDL